MRLALRMIALPLLTFRSSMAELPTDRHEHGQSRRFAFRYWRVASLDFDARQSRFAAASHQELDSAAHILFRPPCMVPSGLLAGVRHVLVQPPGFHLPSDRRLAGVHALVPSVNRASMLPDLRRFVPPLGHRQNSPEVIVLNPPAVPGEPFVALGSVKPPRLSFRAESASRARRSCPDLYPAHDRPTPRCNLGGTAQQTFRTRSVVFRIPPLAAPCRNRPKTVPRIER